MPANLGMATHMAAFAPRAEEPPLAASSFGHLSRSGLAPSAHAAPPAEWTHLGALQERLRAQAQLQAPQAAAAGDAATAAGSCRDAATSVDSRLDATALPSSAAAYTEREPPPPRLPPAIATGAKPEAVSGASARASLPPAASWGQIQWEMATALERVGYAPASAAASPR